METSPEGLVDFFLRGLGIVVSAGRNGDEPRRARGPSGYLWPFMLEELAAMETSPEGLVDRSPRATSPAT